MEKLRELTTQIPLVQAIEYSKLGWPVLPLHSVGRNHGCSCQRAGCRSQAKHPYTEHGSKDASTDPALICQWWTQWPEANIGIATGSVSGLVVIDIDPRHGGDESWAKFEAEHTPMSSLSVATGGGGRHIYYRCPGKSIPNKAGMLPGIDVRGEGGYIVAPYSIHVSGQAYRWEDELNPNLIQNFPKALEELIFSPRTSNSSVRSVPNGKRNTTLTSIAGLLRRHGLDEDGIRSALSSLNRAICTTPIDSSEINLITKSISRYESGGEGSVQVDWSDPQPLPEIKCLVPRLTEDLVPSFLQTWILDIAERMQVPLDFIAAPVLVSMSSVVGRQIGIYPKQKDSWLVVPNLWGAVIARPGYFKSPAIAEALKPLEWLVSKERTRYEAAAVIAQSQEEIIKAKIEGTKENVKKAVRKGNKQEIDGLQYELEEAIKELEQIKVSEKRYKTNDATIEKLGALLLDNPQGLMLFRDELSGWLSGLQKSGREGDREFYLEAWNGFGSYTVDRIGRGTLHVPSLCLSIFGGLQPGKLDAYINHAQQGGAGDDGLLQRFQILVYPETTKKWKNVDRKPDSQSYEKVLDVFNRLSCLRPIELGAERSEKNCVPGLRFDPAAQEVFNDWREKLEQRLRNDELGSPAFESHLSKYRSMVPSLALIFHLGSDQYAQGAVGKSSIELAIKWAHLLEAHAKKVYASTMYSELKAAQALSAKIKAGAIKDGDTVRSVYRKCWSHLESSQKVDTALALLEDLAWLRVEQVKVTYRTKDAIRLNPRLNF